MATVVMTYPRDGGTYGTQPDGSLVPFVARGFVDVPGQVVSIYEDATGALLGSVNAAAVPEASGDYAGWYAWSIAVASWSAAAGAFAPAASASSASGDAGLQGALALPASSATSSAGDIVASSSVLGAMPAATAYTAGAAVTLSAALALPGVEATASAAGLTAVASLAVPAVAATSEAGGVAASGIGSVPAASATSAAGEASISFAAPDTTAPTMTAFTLGTPSGLNVKAATLSATDAVGVTGYLLTESSTPPSAGSGNWQAASYWTTSTGYTFASGGAKTLWAWAKDAAGNVSAVYTSRNVTVAEDPVVAMGAESDASSVAMPAGLQANDIVVIVAAFLDAQTISAPAGWTKKLPASGSSRLYVYWKRTAGTESAVDLNATGAGGFARSFAVRGRVTTGDPFEAVNSTSNATATASTSTTTLTADALLLFAAVARANDGDSEATAIWNAPSGPATTARWVHDDNSAAGSGAVAAAVWSGIKASAGATGTATASFEGYSEVVGTAVALLAMKKAP